MSAAPVAAPSAAAPSAAPVVIGGLQMWRSGQTMTAVALQHTIAIPNAARTARVHAARSAVPGRRWSLLVSENQRMIRRRQTL
jgi:hypothetical protein